MLLLLFSAAVLPGFAEAHAYLQSSDPKQEEVLAASPSAVTISFTEKIEADVGRLSLTDAAGNPIEGSLSSIDEYTLQLRIPELPEGVYLVAWQVLSVDSHVTDGTFRFAVGVPLPAVKPQETVSLGGSGDGGGSSGNAPAPPGPESQTGETTQPSGSTGSGAGDGTLSDAQAEQPTAGSATEQPTPGSAASGSGSTSEEAAADDDPETAGLDEGGSAAGGAEEAAEGEQAPTTTPDTSAPDESSLSGEEEPSARLPGPGSNEAQSERPTAGVPTTKAPTTPKSSPAPRAETEGTADATPVEQSGTQRQPDDLTSAQTLHSAHDHGSSAGHALHTIVRVLDALVLALLGGMLAFRALAGATPASSVWRDGADKSWSRTALAAVVFFIASGAAHFGMLWSELAGIDPAILLLRTNTGWSVVGRPLLCLAVFGAAFVRSAAVRWLVALSAFGLLAFTFPYTGHANAEEQARWLALSSHVAHIGASSAWYGGLLGILYAAGRRRRNNLSDEQHAAAVLALVRTFSLAALPLMMIVAASGLVLSVPHIAAWSDLWTTAYGMLLLAKAALFAAIVALGAFHRRVLLPKAADVRKLVTGVRVEVAIAIVLFTLAGWLATSPPPQQQSAISNDNTPFHYHVMGETAHMSLDVLEPAVGQTQVSADIWVQENTPAPNAVLVTFGIPGTKVSRQYLLEPAEEADAPYAFPGFVKRRFATESVEFDSGGVWSVSVIFTIPGSRAVTYDTLILIRDR